MEWFLSILMAIGILVAFFFFILGMIFIFEKAKAGKIWAKIVALFISVSAVCAFIWLLADSIHFEFFG